MSEFQPIKSSNLKAAKYDAESNVMVVKFKNETMYSYPNIDDHLWNEFESRFDGENGNSAGRFFHREIRHRPCEKIEV